MISFRFWKKGPKQRELNRVRLYFKIESDSITRIDSC